MGYYNDQPPNQTRKKGGGWLVPIIIGLVVGALLMLVVYPNFTGNQTLLDDQHEQSAPGENEGNQTNVTVDVSTQITEVVEKVSPAVVGVTNIQRRTDFWQEGESSEAG